ncbi:alpha/beta hydrolase [Aureibacter tunicatorum]|uniref:Enterochelin esterase-like enzyme n=1 Tax=Aureibacter tunicatorum TaxID=866807 RepID=A0AAE3XS17_9BACT|nr:alpha/beta hydrolase-fold protein [Aureibacter tunicatorum]MDR6241567.1 enterochelin esterase-like enzyme [Aureibacter tunicatorum]BDD07209.1 endo-1,4-beta-xylanase [Aureibacter tunicatorum]
MKYFLTLLLTISSFYSFSQSIVLEDLEHKSQILNSNVKYSVYLPEGYNSSKMKYPVVYLLHGYTGSNTNWVQKGAIKQTADRMIESGELSPCIIIMPDAGNCYYLNASNGKWSYQDMFINEFIPYIENEYSIRTEKSYRAIAGLSMGGFGATMISTNHSGLFGSSVALSGAFWTDEQLISLDQTTFNERFGDMLGDDLKGKKRITSNWKTSNPLHVFTNRNPNDLNQVRWYFDCGDDDFLYEGNSMMHIIMRKRGIEHEFIMRNGGHDWEYWRTGIVNGLKFINKSFMN